MWGNALSRKGPKSERDLGPYPKEKPVGPHDAASYIPTVNHREKAAVFNYLDKPGGLGGGKDAVGLEPQVEALPLEHFFVKNDQLVQS